MDIVADDEMWKPIPSHPGYEASNLGRVRSVDRTLVRKNGVAVRHKGRVLRTRVNTVGHLTIGGGESTRLVHRLVLEAFHGPAPEGMEGCHWNDVKTDNRLSNLRWDTRTANLLDRQRNRIDERQNRTHCPRRHPLLEPNLVPSVKLRGRRSCLACSRTHPRATKAQKLGVPFDFQATSDSYFADIMAKAGTPLAA